MIPGSNLLNMALSVIASQAVDYYKFLSRSVNSIGMDVAVYDDPVEILGSFQVVPRNLYEKYGLDFNKFYATFYTSSDIIDVQRNVSGDQIQFNNARWQCESSNDWYAVDGWKGMLLARIDD